MKIIGITGGIACGKSVVTHLLAEHGAQTRSADDDARAILQSGSPTLAEVQVTFPDTFTSDGTLDRARLAAQIFADPSARKRLEAITHPAIIARMRDAIAKARIGAGVPALVYETPLLYEADLAGLFDTVIAVIATPILQAQRLQQREANTERPPLTEVAIADRLRAQLSPEEKARRADYIIRTDGTMEETRAQVERVWEACRG